MAKNSGTLVGAPIRVIDNLDTYPSAFQNEIKGGHHSVDTLTERDAIYPSRRSPGMTCFVSATNKTYELSTNLLNWTEVLTGTAGPVGPAGVAGPVGPAGPPGGPDVFNVAGRTITRTGLPQGVLLAGSTVGDVLTHFLYPGVPPAATISLGAADRDIGAPTTLTIAWTATQNANPITAINVGGAAQPLSSLSGTIVNQTLSTNSAPATKTITVTAGTDVTTVTATVNHLPRMHWGSTSQSSGFTPAQIRALPNSELRSTRHKTFVSIGTGGNERIVIAIPTSFGVASFRFRGLVSNDWTPISFPTYTNIHGVTIPMTVWVSNQTYNSPLDDFIISNGDIQTFTSPTGSTNSNLPENFSVIGLTSPQNVSPLTDPAAINYASNTGITDANALDVQAFIVGMKALGGTAWSSMRCWITRNGYQHPDIVFSLGGAPEAVAIVRNGSGGVVKNNDEYVYSALGAGVFVANQNILPVNPGFSLMMICKPPTSYQNYGGVFGGRRQFKNFTWYATWKLLHNVSDVASSTQDSVIFPPSIRNSVFINITGERAGTTAKNTAAAVAMVAGTSNYSTSPSDTQTSIFGNGDQTVSSQSSSSIVIFFNTVQESNRVAIYNLIRTTIGKGLSLPTS